MSSSTIPQFSNRNLVSHSSSMAYCSSSFINGNSSSSTSILSTSTSDSSSDQQSNSDGDTAAANEGDIGSYFSSSSSSSSSSSCSSQIIPPHDCLKDSTSCLTPLTINDLILNHSNHHDNSCSQLFDPLNELLMDQQATISLGCVGHVSHGKTTIVRDLTGISTSKFGNEIKRNMTIFLGYANAKVWQCPACNGAPSGYITTNSSVSIRNPPTCSLHSEWSSEPIPMRLVRHISFVDCPGHENLMATMLNGAASMDGALVVIGAPDICPMPQTASHIQALELMKLDPKSILVIQNKIDLVSKQRAQLNYQEIQNALQKTVVGSKAPIIPISAQFKVNLEVIRHWIHNRLPVPLRDITIPPRMLVVRSFDVNHPGTEIDQLVGGIAGGSLQQGLLQVGDEIEIRPGIIITTSTNNNNNNESKRSSKSNPKHHQHQQQQEKEKTTGPPYTCKPIRSRIISLKSENQSLNFIVPGGLIAVGTLLDPALTRGDRLVGQVIGKATDMPGVYCAFKLSYTMMQSVSSVGAPVELLQSKFTKNELLTLYVGTTTVKATVQSIFIPRSSSTSKSASIIVLLQKPVCTDFDRKITIARRANARWWLAAVGEILDGEALIPPTSSGVGSGSIPTEPN